VKHLENRIELAAIKIFEQVLCYEKVAQSGPIQL